jgi:hypothetical protein
MLRWKGPYSSPCLAAAHFMGVETKALGGFQEACPEGRATGRTPNSSLSNLPLSSEAATS